MARMRRAALVAATAALAAGIVVPAAMTAPQAQAAATATAAAPAIPAPVPQGRLRISGTFRDGGTVTASGVRWHVPPLPKGIQLVSLEIAYTWQSCAPGGKSCKTAADSTVTPYAAQQYVIGQADTGRVLRLTETASEVVQEQADPTNFPDITHSVTLLSTTLAGAYPPHKAPESAFVNGLPEGQTASNTEYFQVSAPHANAADGKVTQQYRIDAGPWLALPASRVFSTGTLTVGRHHVTVRTVNGAGETAIRFDWRVVPMPAPMACRSSWTGGCQYPQHLASDGKPMRWDWQIGRATPLERTGKNAVDIYDIDGFLTTKAEITAIETTWQAATLPHPETVCYIDLAWEDYRPDASPGGYFPPATLGSVYYGYPQERWVDLRQLDELEPMLQERISMCAQKGFDAVELDDIDGFDPASTTGFYLTPGDVENFLAYAFNLVHEYGMTALWKNSPYLTSWGRDYTDGAVVEECYVSQQCFASQFAGSKQYGLTCTSLSGATPCGWDDFTTDATRRQPTGKWVGEAEYNEDDYVCNPGQKCATPQEFATFCKAVYAPAYGFAAVKFDVDLDGNTFDTCPG